MNGAKCGELLYSLELLCRLGRAGPFRIAVERREFI